MNTKFKKPNFWNINEIIDDENKGPTETLFLDTMLEWYKEKHRKTSLSEIIFLNSFTPDSCPFCNSIAISKNGHRKDGLQTFKCKKCGKKFNILTNTIFDSHKIPISEWIEFLIHLFEFHSLKTSSRDNKNVETTGSFWLLKIFDVLKNYQNNVKLKGRIYFDETYFKIVKSKIDPSVRKANQITVGVAYDGRHILALNEYVNKESFYSTNKYFRTRFEPGSILIHDGNYSHNELIKDLNLISESHLSSETKNLKGKSNPLYPINQIHNFMKKFIESKDGFNREHLQDWCNLFFLFLILQKIDIKKLFYL